MGNGHDSESEPPAGRFEYDVKIDMKDFGWYKDAVLLYRALARLTNWKLSLKGEYKSHIEPQINLLKTINELWAPHAIVSFIPAPNLRKGTDLEQKVAEMILTPHDIRLPKREDLEFYAGRDTEEMEKDGTRRFLTDMTLGRKVNYPLHKDIEGISTPGNAVMADMVYLLGIEQENKSALQDRISDSIEKKDGFAERWLKPIYIPIRTLNKSLDKLTEENVNEIAANTNISRSELLAAKALFSEYRSDSHHSTDVVINPLSMYLEHRHVDYEFFLKMMFALSEVYDGQDTQKEILKDMEEVHEFRRDLLQKQARDPKTLLDVGSGPLVTTLLHQFKRMHLRLKGEVTEYLVERYNKGSDVVENGDMLYGAQNFRLMANEIDPMRSVLESLATEGVSLLHPSDAKYRGLTRIPDFQTHLNNYLRNAKPIISRISSITDEEVPDNSVDIFTAGYSFHHMQSPLFDPSMKNIVRMSKPGAVFVAGEYRMYDLEPDENGKPWSKDYELLNRKISEALNEEFVEPAEENQYPVHILEKKFGKYLSNMWIIEQPITSPLIDDAKRTLGTTYVIGGIIKK